MINPQTVSSEAVLTLLQGGTLLLTANKRQSAYFRGLYESAQLAAGRAAWDTPRILPWQAWLQNCWEEALLVSTQPLPVVLSQTQENYLWQSIIRESLGDNPLQQFKATVRKAGQAWQLLQQWRLPLTEKAFAASSDNAAFYRWARAFQKRCGQHHWLSQAEISDTLASQAQVLAGQVLASGGAIALLGFDRLTPRQMALLTVLQDHGVSIRYLRLENNHPGRARVLACASAEEEADLLARWARQQLESRPGARIGFVVPDLGERRESLLHSLDKVLSPRGLLAGQTNGQASVHGKTVNVSLGLSLSRYPVVRAALQVLGLSKQQLALSEVGKLLLSPFIHGWREEAAARALLEQRLQEAGEPVISLHGLMYFAGQQGRSHYCPRLLALLQNVQEVLPAMAGRLPAGQWPAVFSRLLVAAGWAAGRSLDSEEYQAAQAWQELLAQLAALEPVAGRLRLNDALSQLRQMADERIFQPQGTPAPIQLLGLLEAEALQFDCLWVCGLHDGAWPPAARPSPFLPLAWQREQQLPGCSEQAVLDQSRQMTDGWLCSADDIVFSYPCRDGEAELGRSPLLADIESAGIDSIDRWRGESSRDVIHRHAQLESLTQDPAPPLRPGTEATAGGSYLFTLQAACPFRAFAEGRLGARATRQAEIGLNAMQRGSLLHLVMESVWQQLGDQQRLLAMSAADLNKLIADCTGRVMQANSRFYPQTLKGRFLELETTRLAKQVARWLEEVEKKRPPFRVLEQEAKHVLNAGAISVNIKIDRVDELTDGRRVIIDYKTGSVSAAKWFGERPDEPQLPLYSMAVDGEIAALCFAQIRAGEFVFKGVSAEDDLLPKVKAYSALPQAGDYESWQQLLQHWRQVMEKLASEYRRGRADVCPKTAHSCDYCELGPLCRINEHTVLDEHDEVAV